MRDYDIEFINLLQGSLSDESSSQIQQTQAKDIKRQFSNLTNQNGIIDSKVNLLYRNNEATKKSYIMSLLSSEYPNSLLSECRSLDLESQMLKDSIQKISLENSSRILKKNKEVILELKKKFGEFDESTNHSVFQYFPLISKDVLSYKTTVSQNLSIFRKLSILKRIFPIIAEFIELPDLIENLISSNMIDDALDALEYGESTVKLLEASIFSISNGDLEYEKESSAILLIKTIKNRLEITKMTFYSTLKSKLNFDQLSMINTIELIGQLRRLVQIQDKNFVLTMNLMDGVPIQQKEEVNQIAIRLEDNDYILAKIFLNIRSEFINLEYIKKSQTLLKVNRYASLKSAISLFKVPVITTISILNSLFSNKDITLNLSNCWLNGYIEWFINICRNSLTLVKNNLYTKYSNRNLEKNSEDFFTKTSLQSKTVYIALFDLDEIPITSSSCKDIYLQVYDIFSFSKPILLLILPLFENYMVEYYRKMLEFCLESFIFELKNFDWKKELRKMELKIVNMRPLAVLYNEFTNTINELKQCSFSSIKYFVVDLTIEFLCISTLKIEITGGNIDKNVINNRDELEIDQIKRNISDFITIFDSEFSTYVISSISSIFDLDESTFNKQLEEIKNYKTRS